jgi:hypothetical protein
VSTIFPTITLAGQGTIQHFGVGAFSLVGRLRNPDRSGVIGAGFFNRRVFRRQPMVMR